MLVHIVLFGRVVLHHALVLAEEHILDRTHLVPGRTALPLAVTGTNADVLPASTVTGNTEK